MGKPEKTGRLPGLLDFSLHSLPHSYGRLFLRRILLRHPRRSASGLWHYLRQDQSEAGECQLIDNAGIGFVPGAATDPGRLLVATGYCQKPLALANSHDGCPAGRFNHDCLCLPTLRLGPPAEIPGDPACKHCFVRTLGHAALRAGACFAILTSALDIANDILLPALEEGRFTHCLLAACPYSLAPLGLALSVCSVDGYVLTFGTGACTDFRQWLRADQGLRPEQTTLSDRSAGKMLRLLNLIAELTPGRGRLAGFEHRGNIYKPSAGVSQAAVTRAR